MIFLLFLDPILLFSKGMRSGIKERGVNERGEEEMENKEIIEEIEALIEELNNQHEIGGLEVPEWEILRLRWIVEQLETLEGS